MRGPAARAGPAGEPGRLSPLPERVALTGARTAARTGRLRLPLGLVDDPAGQRQDVWSVDLARAGGHVAVIGAPQSGRSTVLRSIAVSAARTHMPREISIYGMDLSGGGLRGTAGFPHVGGVATRGQRDRLQRVVEELLGMLAAREKVLTEHGIDSLGMLRVEHAAGRTRSWSRRTCCCWSTASGRCGPTSRPWRSRC